MAWHHDGHFIAAHSSTAGRGELAKKRGCLTSDVDATLPTAMPER